MRTGIIRPIPSLLQVQRTKLAVLANAAGFCRTFSCVSPLSTKDAVTSNGNQDEGDGRMANEGKGAMSRRLLEMTEETILRGGASDAKNVEAAGFSEESKKRLESRLTDSSFRSRNQRAFSVAELPVCTRLVWSCILFILGQYLTSASRSQAKEVKIKPSLNRGLVPKLYPTLLYECWMTVTNHYVASAPHASPSQEICALT